MKRIIALAGIAVIGSLFIMCPAEESPANPPLSVQVQGHVYDNQTKQPVADNYVGLYWQRQAEDAVSGLTSRLPLPEPTPGAFIPFKELLTLKPARSGQ